MTQTTKPASPGKPQAAVRWRWYHYYFLLALFDVVVIVAGFLLLQQTLSSYHRALKRLTSIHGRQQWIISLRLKVIDLNAPGNDVFETRRVDESRTRFAQMEDRLRRLLVREQEFEEDLSEFRAHVEKMVAEEGRIFDLLAPVEQEPTSPERLREALEAASVAMAGMDRAQANALNSLTELDQLLLMQTASLLKEYGSRLQRSAAAARYFGGAMVVILAGVFWYGRKLQRLHDEMLLHEQQVVAERRERLAAVGEVCSAVAHGIRNPLAAVSSSAQLVLGHAALDDAARRRVGDILAECRRLDQRITRLLNFAAVPLRAPEVYDLATVIEQAIHEVRPGLEERNLRLTREFDPPPLAVRGDRERMTQSIIELIANAMDHVPAGGSIHIACHRDLTRERTVILDIADDGPGIPEHARAHVFELFFTSKPQGTGIGLASVKRAVEFHGGTVCVVADGRPGAHVRITLPTV
ncbi:MAG: HAMP domain-containing histidine kinase [Planctomycetes bacterium]|nr:HAMP domain-containing histidine kinase [Planctomycetota bacterium]